MTHYDAAGWGPASAAAPGSRAETTQVGSGKYTHDVCDSYTGSQGQASGGYLAAALAVAEELAAGPTPYAPPPPGANKCWPGHAHSHEPIDYDCPGYKAGFDSKQCEAVGCCTDAKLYPSRASGWCYPPFNASAHHTPSDPALKPEFIYNTHPFIVQEYFNATASCGSSHRNATSLAAVEKGIKDGIFSWHAKPFTVIHELSDPELYAWSLGIAKRLNVQFGVSHGLVTGKITDLPGVSIGIVPLLAKAGIKALHIGTNGQGDQAFTSFPGGGNLPQVFRWKHPATGDEVVVMNEQGYGRMIVPDRTFGLTDALRWQFTGDNEQPPTANMVRACWEYAKAHQFPNAKLKASTLDEFGQILWDARDRLPIVSQEIGNSWLPQMGTDPWRLRAIRAVSRLRNAWVSDGRISAEDAGLNQYQTRLLIPIEHNFGMAVRKVINNTEHLTCWTNGCFHPRMKTGGAGSKGCATYDGICTGYDGLEEFARERDTFLYPLDEKDGKGSEQYKAFAAQANRTLTELAIVPALASRLTVLKEVDISDPTALQLKSDGVAVGFDERTGAIKSLVSAGIEWAGGDKRLGEFVYRTYTELHDIDRFVAQFTPNYAGAYPNHRNKSTDAAGSCWQHPEMDRSILSDPAMAHLPLESISRAWNVSLSKAWKDAAGRTMLLQLSLPRDAVTLFGGMTEIVVNVTIAGMDEVEVSLSWKGKTPTRLAESSWLSFNPSLPTPTANEGWKLDVLGHPVDPMSVVFNGSRHFHAVHRGVCYQTDAPAGTKQRLAIDSMDAPLVAPGTTAKIIDFDNKLPDLSGGMHFSLHNNVGWDCSAPWWYGKDEHYRFRLRLNPKEEGCW